MIGELFDQIVSVLRADGNQRFHGCDVMGWYVMLFEFLT